MSKPFKAVLIMSVFLALAADAVPVFGQSCSLCYTQAASATQQFIQGLRSGILVLIIPPFLMWSATLVVIYRRRNRFRTDETKPDPLSW